MKNTGYNRRVVSNQQNDKISFFLFYFKCVVMSFAPTFTESIITTGLVMNTFSIELWVEKGYPPNQIIKFHYV